MPLLGVLSLLFQVYFVVHALKTGRDRFWVYIIIIFPGVGCLVYFFVEFLPELQHNPAARKAGSKIVNIADPGRELRRLKEQLEISDSIKNRKLLAEGYINAGFFDEAISLYKSCLEGLYENDPYIWEGLSCAYFFKGNFEEAKKYLYKLKEMRGENQSQEFDLLLARTLEESGDTDGALKEYDLLVKRFSGEEARCRYALLLKKLGKPGDAEHIFREIVKNARLSPKYYKKVQKKWIAIAKKELKEMPA